MFFKLKIYHNNRNKSMNFIFIWNQANKKKLMRSRIQTRAGMINETFFFSMGAKNKNMNSLNELSLENCFYDRKIRKMFVQND